MSQLLKHYFLDRDTGKYALTPADGYMVPNIKGLDIIYRLSDANDMEYCLSNCPDYFEYSVTVSQEVLTEYQNNPNITIVSSSERQEEVVVRNPETLEQTDQTETITVYDVVYQEDYIIDEVEGLWIITQEDWDNEINSYDARQEQKRMDILRDIRDEILKLTDWIVIKAKEQGTNLSAEFKTWRQELRDLPSGNFPASFPTIPTSLENDTEIQKLYDRFDEVRSIAMINDPLPPLPEPESII
jgi:hypothetical protein